MKLTEYEESQLLNEATDLLAEIIFDEEALDIHKENPIGNDTMYSSSARAIILLDKLGYEIDKELVAEAKRNMEE
jgi:hypothetical protein